MSQKSFWLVDMPRYNSEYYQNRDKVHSMCYHAWALFSPDTRLRVLREHHIRIDCEGEENFGDEIKYWDSFVDVSRFVFRPDFELLVSGIVQEFFLFALFYGDFWS